MGPAYLSWSAIRACPFPFVALSMIRAAPSFPPRRRGVPLFRPPAPIGSATSRALIYAPPGWEGGVFVCGATNGFRACGPSKLVKVPFGPPARECAIGLRASARGPLKGCGPVSFLSPPRAASERPGASLRPARASPARARVFVGLFLGPSVRIVRGSALGLPPAVRGQRPGKVRGCRPPAAKRPSRAQGPTSGGPLGPFLPLSVARAPRPPGCVSSLLGVLAMPPSMAMVGE